MPGIIELPLMKPPFALAAVLLLLAGSPGSRAEGPSIYESQYDWDHPDSVEVSEEELLVPLPDSAYYRARTYAFHGRLNDGHVFVIDLFQWSYALVGTWGLIVEVAEPGKELYYYEGRIPPDRVSAASDRFSIRFGDSSLEGAEGSSRVRLELEGFSCDLRLRDLVAPWKPGNGYAYFTSSKEAYLHFLLAPPVALLSGWMRVGEELMDADGLCSGSRSITVLPLGRMSSDYYGFQLFEAGDARSADTWFLALHHYQGSDEGKPLPVPLLVLNRGGRWLLTSRSYTLTPQGFKQQPGFSYPYPSRMEIEAESNGYSLKGHFICTEVLRCQDVTESLPSLVGGILSLFGKRPIIFRMSGVFSGTLRLPDGSLEPLILHGLGSYSTFR
jgi:hypothetical protein